MKKIAVSTNASSVQAIPAEVFTQLQSLGFDVDRHDALSGASKALFSNLYERSFNAADAYVYAGKLSPLDVFSLMQVADHAQTGLGESFLRDGNGGYAPGSKEGLHQVKPIIVVDYKDDQGRSSRTLIEDVFQQLHRNGFLRSASTDYIKFLDTPGKIAASVQNAFADGKIFDINKHLGPPPPQEDIPNSVPKLKNPEKPTVMLACSWGVKSDYFVEVAKQMHILADAGYDLVTGGGDYMIADGAKKGMMAHSQVAAEQAGAHVTGVTYPGLLSMADTHNGKPIPALGISHMHIVPNVGERLDKMLGHHPDVNIDAVLVMPSGLGGLAELFAATQVHHKKPIILANLLNPETGERIFDATIRLAEASGLEKDKDFIVIEPPVITRDGREHHTLDAGIDMAEVNIKASAAQAIEEAVKAINQQARTGKMGNKWQEWIIDKKPVSPAAVKP